MTFTAVDHPTDHRGLHRAIGRLIEILHGQDLEAHIADRPRTDSTVGIEISIAGNTHRVEDLINSVSAVLLDDGGEES